MFGLAVLLAWAALSIPSSCASASSCVPKSFRECNSYCSMKSERPRKRQSAAKTGQFRFVLRPKQQENRVRKAGAEATAAATAATEATPPTLIGVDDRVLRTKAGMSLKKKKIRVITIRQNPKHLS